MSRSATVLLIEDNEMEQTMARRAIDKAEIDCRVLYASDGAQACDTLFDTRLRPPDLILLDLHLPKINGFEVLERIRSDDRTRRVPVVVMSSSSDQRDVTLSYDLSANSFISKSVDPDTYDSLMKLVLYYWVGVNRASE